MELPPPHVLLQLDAIIVAQRESDGAGVVATASAAATPRHDSAHERALSSQILPGREFDNLDEFRAAKKQRAEQRIAYSDQNIGYRGSSSGKWSSLRHML